MIRIGFVGYCDESKYDHKKALDIVQHIFAMLEHSDIDICVVTGLTNVGILKLVYKYARKCGFETGGIACSKAHQQSCFPVNWEVIVGDEWGDESETFLSSIDYLVKLGGGKQSIEEYRQFNGPKVEFNLKEII